MGQADSETASKEEVKELSRRQLLKATGAAAARFMLGDVNRESFLRAQERQKSPEEVEVESVVRQTYCQYLGKLNLGNQELLIRIPFGEDQERFPGQRIFQGGKGAPGEFWREVERWLGGEEFGRYQDQLSQPGEKLVLFDLPGRSYQVFSEPSQIESITAHYQRNKLHPYELKQEGGLSEIDVYNFLYAIGRVGVDCSGFVFSLQRAITERFGVDLCQEIGREWGVNPKDVPTYIGTSYYASEEALAVPDQIINLRPGDLILFPSWSRPVCHSAVVQSVDLTEGRIRYVQSVDWVDDRRRRGPHSSVIDFDPRFPRRSLMDPEVKWRQVMGPVFLSESSFYQGDGARYRLEPYCGQVVRLKKVAEVLAQANPLYYSNMSGKYEIL